MYYPFLHEYKVDRELISQAIAERQKLKFRHIFYNLSEEDISAALSEFDPFPRELKTFYEEIGFGYFHLHKEQTNRILDPYSLVWINRAKGQYRNNKLLQNTKSEDRLVFFQTFNGLYLTIDIHDENGKNAVYYRGECLRTSLQDFLNVYSQGRDYLNDNMKGIDNELAKQGKPPETLRDLFHDSPQPPKVRTSFARSEVKQVQDPPKPVAQKTSAPPFMPGSWTIVD